MKTAFNIFDVIRFKNSANTIHSNGGELYGIVREINETELFAEWFDRATATKSRKIADSPLDKWISINDVELVGDFYSIIKSSLSKTSITVPEKKKVEIPATSVDTTSVTEQVIEIPVERTKRKYTRKPGAAKPGPKPKKPVVESTTEVTAEVNVTEPVTPALMKFEEITYVERPYVGRWSPRLINKEDLRNKYTMATGKFKHFPVREDIEKSMKTFSHYYPHVNSNLDLVIVGEKPGPSKIEKFQGMRISMITEEQWLALIGHPKFKFNDEKPVGETA